MEAKVSNFRGAVSAAIKISGVTLIAGKNEHGKSSVCEAVGAALTGHPVPLLVPGSKAGEYKALVTKKDAAIMVNGGQKGHVVVETAQGKATISWPACDFETEGAAPGASVFATGLIDPLELSDKQRAALLSDALGALPTREDLEAQLEEDEFRWDKSAPDDKNIVARIWKAIEIDGWDATHEEMKKHGAKLKGQWEEIVASVSEGKVKYGMAKAVDWKPEGWEDDLDEATDEKLYADVASAQANLEHEIGQGALGADEIARLKEVSAARPSDDDLAALQKAVDDAEDDYDAAVAERKKLPERVDDAGYLVLPCPHCDEPVQVKNRDGVSLIKPEKRPSDAEIKKIRMEIASADGVVGNKEMAVHRAKREYDEAKKRLADAIEADANLERASEGNDNGDKIAAAREALERAQRRMKMADAYQKAHRKHRQIFNNQIAIDALSPDGVRQKVLRKSLHRFNETYCKPLSRAAGWRQVMIDEDMLPTMAGRHWRLLCKSEQWRARAILQIALAKLDGSALVILDGADILDKRHRNGLFKMLTNIELPALVNMTMNKPEQVPDLAKAGVGRSYWIEEGSVDLIGTQEEAI